MESNRRGGSLSQDGIKALLAGADVAQMVSAILRHGPSYFAVMLQELRRWTDSLEIVSLNDVRGRLSLAHTEAPSEFERGQYIRTLSDWRSWLGYEATRRLRPDDDERPPW